MLVALLAVTTVEAFANPPEFCPPLHRKGVLALDFNPAFLSIDGFSARNGTSDGLIASSFFNIDPPTNTPDLVALIPDIGRVKASPL